MPSNHELPKFHQVLPALEHDIKERIEKLIFELFTTGTWFDVYELRGGHISKGDVDKILPFADADAAANDDLVFDFRFRIPNSGKVREAFSEVLETRANVKELTEQEKIAAIDAKIAELQELRASFTKTNTMVAWEEPKEPAHPSWSEE